MMVLSANLAVSNHQISEEVRSMSSISISEFPYTALISDIIQLAFRSLIKMKKKKIKMLRSQIGLIRKMIERLRILKRNWIYLSMV